MERSCARGQKKRKEKSKEFEILGPGARGGEHRARGDLAAGYVSGQSLSKAPSRTSRVRAVRPVRASRQRLSWKR